MAPLESRNWPNEIEDPVWFANSQWAVTDFGLESLDPNNAYEVGHVQLLNTHEGNGTDHSAILEHVSSKGWVDIQALFEAFRFAMGHFYADQELPFDVDADIASLSRYR